MKIAAIDIGTNSVHMVVVEVNPEHGLSVIDRQKTMVRLGQGLFGTMRLSERAFADGLDVLRRYVKLAESRGVEEVLAVATSATREAENGTEFLDATFRETGVLPRVISGTEEARLIFLAVRHALDMQKERALVLDIGGGSVELSLGTQTQVLMNESLRLGVQRLLDHHGTSAPLTMRELYELQGYVHGAAAEVMSQAHKLGFDRVVGTSGTIRTLGEAAHLATGGTAWRSLNAQTAKKRDIRDLTRRLVELDSVKRAKIEGIGEARADTIHLGGVLLTELLEMAEVEELTLCDASLREGVIWDFLERHGRAPTTHAPIPDPRRRSIVELARKYERDDPREHHIARLSLELFDQTVEIHGFGAYERELLEYAALVHGVGRQIGYADRHRHSRYIVRNSTLRGFTEEEIELLGLLVLYHRGERPKKSHERIARLETEQQRLVKVLSAILRLAVALDRGHSQLVKRLRCYIFPTRLDIVVDGPGDLELELLAARDKLEPLARALRREITIDRSAPYSASDGVVRN
ncbi:MAG TPA: Ppx/GppA phosphatase family protein [Polyangiaceae bacterium]|jgi:exopolyphosphatase/guanosine-5'-triphosphate,3'-diphosphate pyrophosphatase|nr:Ppx/GppA phosphatase family protein [Polyangiaceae bacterium]